MDYKPFICYLIKTLESDVLSAPKETNITGSILMVR